MAQDTFGDNLDTFDQSLVPPLSFAHRKGDMGRIAIVGGSFEYTGAPYYTSIGALRAGADLAFVFCSEDAAIPIKAYSPELIVYPALPADNTSDLNKAIDDATLLFRTVARRLHAVVIGPGLSRHPNKLSCASSILRAAQELNLLCVLDGDGINVILQSPELIKQPLLIALTPNHSEFVRLCDKFGVDSTQDNATIKLSSLLGGCLLLRKGPIDQITDSNNSLSCRVPGSPRRCGGQGDVLAGVLATFLHWSTLVEQQDETIHLRAARNACCLVRAAAHHAYQQHGRSMLTTTLIDSIGPVFTRILRLKA